MTSDHGIWILRKAGRLAGLAFRTTVLVQVTAAHAGRFHFDHDLVRAWRGIGKLHQFQFAATGEHHTTHGSLHLLAWLRLERPCRSGESDQVNGRASAGASGAKYQAWRQRLAIQGGAICASGRGELLDRRSAYRRDTRIL